MQPENKNDGMEFPTRYQCYLFAKRHIRGECRPEVFPLGEANGIYTESDGQITRAIDSNYHKGWLDNQQRTMVKYGTSQDQKISRGISQSLNAGHFNQPKVAICDSGLHRKKQRPHGFNKGGKKELPCVVRKDGGLTLERLGMCVAITDSGLHRKSQIRTKTLPPLRANSGAGHNNLIAKRVLKYNRPEYDLGNDTYYVPEGQSIRRLTPVECERLQGFPEIKINMQFEFNSLQTDEFFVILSNKGDNIKCIEYQKNSVNAEKKNHKLQKHVGNVEKSKLKENAKSVEKNSISKNQQISKHARQHVLINCEESTVERHRAEKLLSDVNIVGKTKLCLRLIKPEDFVRLIVDINLILEKITHYGKGELHQKEPYLILQKNGKMLVKLSGKEIMRHVKDVLSGLITHKELLKSITLNHSSTKNIEQNLIILFSCVLIAITGHIPIETLTKNTYQINMSHGWTEWGLFDDEIKEISDTQRYKTLGNAVTTNVIEAIIKQFKLTGA